MIGLLRRAVFGRLFAAQVLALTGTGLLTVALGLLLLVVSYHWLFGGTALGFLGSALLIGTTALPRRATEKPRLFRERLKRGLRIYPATPRLRGQLALTLTAAAAGAFVIVNTVVVVREGYGGNNRDVALALACFGGGSMLAALLLPNLLDRTGDRQAMIGGAVLLTGLMTAFEAAPTFAVLTLLGGIGVALALRLWPEGDPVIVPHSHPDLPADHPHLRGTGPRHAHTLVIDDEHHAWPTHG